MGSSSSTCSEVFAWGLPVGFGGGWLAPCVNLADMLENHELRRGDVPSCPLALSIDPERAFRFDVAVPLVPLVALLPLLTAPEFVFPFVWPLALDSADVGGLGRLEDDVFDCCGCGMGGDAGFLFILSKERQKK